jgi:hypothetical protein
MENENVDEIRRAKVAKLYNQLNSKSAEVTCLESALDAALADNAALMSSMNTIQNIIGHLTDFPDNASEAENYIIRMMHGLFATPHPGDALLAERDALRAEVIQLKEGSIIEHVVDSPELLAERDRLRKALENLVAKADAVFADPSLEAIHQIAFAHGVKYTGPVITEELNDARAALAKEASND